MALDQDVTACSLNRALGVQGLLYADPYYAPLCKRMS